MDRNATSSITNINDVHLAEVARRRAHNANVVMFYIGCVLIVSSLIMIPFIVMAKNMMVGNNCIQEIGLENFTVSNLNIGDDQISGDWTISLSLENPARKAAVYTDIRYTITLSTAPHVPIVDFHHGYPLVQPRKNQTVVYRTGSVEELRLNHPTTGSINGGVLEFDLAVVARCKNAGLINAGLLELTCRGINVILTSPSNSSSNSSSSLKNATGYATEIPVCNLVKSRVFDH